MKKFLPGLLLLLSVNYMQAQGLDSIQLAKGFIESLKRGNADSLKKLVAPPEVYRKIYPKETEQMSDADLIAQTAGNPKLKADYDSLLAKAKSRKVDLKNLQYDSLRAENVWGTDNAPWAMTVYYTYKGKSDSFAISVIRFEGSWYFMEILVTSDAFKEF